MLRAFGGPTGRHPSLAVIALNFMLTENTSEIHKLLKLGEHAAESVHHVPASLPIVTQHPAVEGLELTDKTTGRVKTMFIYALVFMAAFAGFYAVLNFSAITAQFQGWFIRPQGE